MAVAVAGAETSFVLPPEEGEGKISLRFHQAVSKNGNRELPSMFYKGVMFGITSQNSHSLEVRQPPPPPTHTHTHHPSPRFYGRETSLRLVELVVFNGFASVFVPFLSSSAHRLADIIVPI